jgi:hypothetical protein
MLAVIGVLAVVVVIALSMAWTAGRSREILDRWAAANGYTILEAERRYLRRGPFFLRSGEGHQVFHVALRDAGGRTRGGYVRIGGWWLGLLADKVVVEWDD